MPPFARIAVSLPLHRCFHYRIPDQLEPWVRVGVRCTVPFGRRRAVGFVVGLDERSEVENVRHIQEVLDPSPVLTQDLVDLGLWLAAYYHHPVGETLSGLLPPSYRATSEPCYSIRQGGADREVDSAQRRLLRRIEECGELPASRVRASEAPALRELLRSGVILRDWRVRPPPELRGERWAFLGPQAPAPDAIRARAPRQAEILDSLAAGCVRVRDLYAAGSSSDALRRVVEKGWVEMLEKLPEASDPSPLGLDGGAGPRPELTGEQDRALADVSEGLLAGTFRCILLQGVTGSGKTEVYIRAVERVRSLGRGALILVPEIALTPQILGRFLAAFPREVAILHSALGPRERRLQWERVRKGEAPIALGARSAVFAPVPDLGLVVVDEEHEPSYKQEEGLRYHAKHVALMRSRASGAVTILGSATPDVETYFWAASGRYGHLALTRRVREARLPEIRVVDLRQEERRRRSRVLLSEPLRQAVTAVLDRGEQALLFLNRRGFSPAFVCPSCGEAVECRRCSVALTLHRSRNGSELLCHYCGARKAVPHRCPSCESVDIAPAGAGTQRLVESVSQIWPVARVARLDRDTVRGEGGTQVLRAFGRGEADILVGTQMVTKGHHFPNLTVVGVVDADQSLHFPDFRAGERTFQALTQVAGRAGRDAAKGVVYLQTRNPDHPIIRAAADGNYEEFAREELAMRREAGFPPFQRLGLFRISSPEEDAARGTANTVAEQARTRGASRGVDVLGPAPAPIERVRGRWRYHVLLRGPGPEAGALQATIRELLELPALSPRGDLRVHVDVDPVSLL